MCFPSSEKGGGDECSSLLVSSSPPLLHSERARGKASQARAAKTKVGGIVLRGRVHADVRLVVYLGVFFIWCPNRAVRLGQSDLLC